MFHDIVYKLTKINDLGCGWVALKNILAGRKDGNKGIYSCLT